MRRKGIVRTEDLFGPGGWDGPELVETRGMEPYDACVKLLVFLLLACDQQTAHLVSSLLLIVDRIAISGRRLPSLAFSALHASTQAREST